MDRRVEKAYNLIKRRFGEKLLLKDIAAIVGLSPYHFQRLFTSEMGESPAACLNRLRLERAAHLMRAGTNWSISEIGINCGFPSLSSFSRAFSKKFNMSPQGWLHHMPDGIVAPGVINAVTSEGPRVIRLKQSDIDQLKVEVVYQPDLYVFYNQTSLTNPDLLNAFAQAKAFCELNGIPVGLKQIGIMTHITFHYPEAKLNYNAGIEIRSNSVGKFRDRIFLISKGKYACITTRHSVRSVDEVMMMLHLGWMKKYGYVRRDLFSFEEILPGNKKEDYPFLSRKIFVPIVRKE